MTYSVDKVTMTNQEKKTKLANMKNELDQLYAETERKKTMMDQQISKKKYYDYYLLKYTNGDCNFENSLNESNTEFEDTISEKKLMKTVLKKKEEESDKERSKLIQQKDFYFNNSVNGSEYSLKNLEVKLAVNNEALQNQTAIVKDLAERSGEMDRKIAAVKESINRSLQQFERQEKMLNDQISSCVLKRFDKTEEQIEEAKKAMKQKLQDLGIQVD